MKHITPLLLSVLGLFPNVQAQDLQSTATANVVTIDGVANEADWDNATWYDIGYSAWGGELPDAADFTGRFKSLWDANYLYLLLEVVDNELSDDHVDPLTSYWEDDCVEIFIDENNTPEGHQNDHDAFAYHVSLAGDVVDIGLGASPILLNDHIASNLVSEGNNHVWELKISVYDDSFDENASNNSPVTLVKDKIMGFTVGYCDNDETNGREDFIISDADQFDTGWLESTYFGQLTLVNGFTGIPAASHDQSVLIYPQPFSQSFTVELNAAAVGMLYDVTGELVEQWSIPIGSTVVEPQVRPGVYLFSVATATNTQVVRMVKK